MRQQIHTPEGVRDIYGVEYQKKLVLEDKLQKVLHVRRRKKNSINETSEEK